jgi:hypothetical protein
MGQLSRATVTIGMCALAGCAEGTAGPRVDARLVDHVQVSRAEPGAACRSLGAVDGKVDDDCDDSCGYEAAYDALRAAAALRGGNYVVLDSFAGGRSIGGYDGPMALQGRVYSCPLGWPRELRELDAGPAQTPGPSIDRWTPPVIPPAMITPPALPPPGAPQGIPSGGATIEASASLSSPLVLPVQSPSTTCEPDCSPGYVCARGACVSACNPVCWAGQRCGEDRVCH